MDQVHRNIIQRNHCELLHNCNFQTLIPKLVKNNVFTKDTIRAYEKCDYESRVNLLFDLLGRGPHAFDNFILSLKESHQTNLANKLLGIKDASPVHTHTVPIFPNNFLEYNPINLTTERLRIEVISSETFKDDFSQLLNPYTMRSKSRGAVLIINNKIFTKDKPRKGSQIDQENLVDLFKQMGGYNIIVKENLTASEMQRDIANFSKNNLLRTIDVMFVIIMSHGSAYVNESQVKCKDEEYVRTSWIESQFHGDSCPYMQNKPKIIIYQICRGSDLDSGVRKTETDGLGLSIPTRKHSDMLICHSTSQGYKAHRDTELGSWYIQCLCEVFMKYAHSDHIETMLHAVDKNLSTLQSDDVDKTMQTPNFYNLGFRHCFLNPGIYEENKQLYRYND